MSDKKKVRISKEEILKIERRARREAARLAGYYDGRNRPRVVPDKKKERSRRKCREKIERER